MTQENLENIKKYCRNVKEYKKDIEELLNKKRILSKTKEVQEYLKVVNNLELLNGSSDQIKQMNDSYILNQAIDKEKIVITNNIYVCMGTYKDNGSNGYGVYRVASDSDDAQYRIYKNIEKELSDAYIEVPIEQCLNFESQNYVFYPETLKEEEFYNLVRELFFETAIQKDQEQAVIKVKQLTNK